MNVKFVSLLNSMLAVLVLAACAGSAQPGTPEESRRGGFWVFILFLALAGFFWWWLRNSDGEAAVKYSPAVSPARSDSNVRKPAAPAVPSVPAAATSSRAEKPVAAQEKPVEQPAAVVQATAAEEVSKVVETVAQPVESVKAESAVPVAAVVADSVEENPVQARRAMTDKQKKAQKKGPNGEDDLTIVEGIGPKINGVLHVAGINTYAELANSTVETLRQILVQNSLQYHDPGTWAEQSALAAADKWDELEQLQGTLSGGKRK